MIYVKRNADGAIVAVSQESIPAEDAGGATWHEARGDEPELIAFGHAIMAAGNPLGSTDLGLVRVLEDLIDLLVDRSVIRFTDLPPAAQAKLADRRGTRAVMQELRLLDDENENVI